MDATNTALKTSRASAVGAPKRRLDCRWQRHTAYQRRRNGSTKRRRLEQSPERMESLPRRARGSTLTALVASPRATKDGIVNVAQNPTVGASCLFRGSTANCRSPPLRKTYRQTAADRAKIPSRAAPLPGGTGARTGALGSDAPRE